MANIIKNIEIRGARQHNLKNVDVDIPIDSLTVITGLSGSGKSSLAFDTLYAEGQRRYVESLSSYARQFLGVMNKPDVDAIHGLSPAISIEQKKLSQNPRSTVGTVTEIYDYLRLLYARVGTPYCPLCDHVIKKQDAQTITKAILNQHNGARVYMLASLIRGKKGTYDYLFPDLKKQGFSRVRVDGSFYNLGTETIPMKRYASHTIEVVVDRLAVTAEEKTRIHDAVEQSLKLGAGSMTLLIERPEKTFTTGGEKYEEKMFSQHLACPDCGLSFEELQPRSFSFNAPQGACQQCHGIGSIQEFDEKSVIPNDELSLMEGGIAAWKVVGMPVKTIEAFAKHFDFDPWTPLKDVPREALDALLHGTEENLGGGIQAHRGGGLVYSGAFEGVIPQLQRLFKKTDSDDRREEIGRYMREKMCPACKGKRLRPESLAVRVGGRSIIDLTDLSLGDVYLFFGELMLPEREELIARQILKEIQGRISFLVNVGLDYLTLSRSTKTLSGGEGQRIHLATQIGSELRGVLYILDEPSIGLHQRDNRRLIDTLEHLRNLGNTVIVVEHDEDTMRAADHIIDVGPGAGVHGGVIVASGTAAQIMKNKDSMTGQYLSGKKTIAIPKKRRPARGVLKLVDAREHNLKNVTAEIPLGTFCCVTGVSGSGKSTLINDTLYPALAKHFYDASQEPGEYDRIEGLQLIDKAVVIDQTPIGRTPRSNPATYTGLFTYIRELFAATKEAKMRGYQIGRFSFNVPDGRCGNCNGDGLIKIEMHFLSDVYIACEVCGGKRYDDETLSILYKQKSIAGVLDMTVEEAVTFFGHIPRIKNKLQTLNDVGLGYITLGQSSTTLSGGEAQRVKLATELSRRDTGRTLYLLDEPTTGLHFEDIQRLLGVLQRLVEKGNTVLVIEHNLDVIKTADYIIDLGPEGGFRGGQIIATGTPEEVAKVKGSYTGQFLKEVLK